MGTKQSAYDIFTKCKYLTLATATKDCQPWVSPLFYAYDREGNIYWSSSKNAKHSKLLKENESVALVISSGHMTNHHWEALYITGIAHEVNEDEFADALDLYYKRGHPLLIEDEQHVLFAKDFSNEDAPRRLYKCIPQKAYLLSPPISTSDQLVEARTEIDLSELKTE